MKRYHVTLEVDLENNVRPKDVLWGVPGARLCGFSEVFVPVAPGEPQTIVVDGVDLHGGMGEAPEKAN